MATKLEGKEITEQQELFCEFYATDTEFFGNGVKSYMKAYPDADYKSARTGAYRMLTNVDILARINELLEDMALNDAFVDKQIGMLITQNADWGTKMAAIKEYNALKKRITQKIEVTTQEEQNLEAVAKDLANDPANKLVNLPDDSAEVASETTETDTPTA
jgi:seryl-tRNA synthetase